MKKNSVILLLIVAVFGLSVYTGCKTKPDVEDSTTTTTTIASTTTTIVTQDKLSSEQIAEVRELIEKAKKAEAEKYDPDNLKNSQDELNEAVRLNDEDVAKAVSLWESSKKKAIDAYNNSFKIKAEIKKKSCNELFINAEKIGAKDFAKDSYKSAEELYSEGDDYYNNTEYVTSYNKFSDCENQLKKIIKEIEAVEKEYKDRIDYVKKLIEEAKKLGAEQYAKEELDSAVTKLDEGISYLENIQYSESKSSVDEAEKYAVSAIEKTKYALKELKRLEALKAIKDAGKTIEDASKVDVGDGSKKDYKFDFDDEKKDLQNSPDNDSAVSYRDLFNKAIEYIEKAKQAYRNEDYDMAIQYANIAKKIALSYKEGGDKLKYTVRLIPDKRDCLWRISEYNFIYNTPFLWPRIWKANKSIIINPDLIYPGQVLSIPNVD